ncbi:MAG: nicotinate (nicotinamide) nucleotide adenylyltransferase [Phycisphaerae bacterium]|nr:nicotinate (nicotinamide) nucleotide adenylyltransferase [Phycisphaerae bacterium]
MARGGLLLFGGSFNPIHVGHLIIARAAAEQLGVERTILIPSAAPPHKTGSDLAAPEDRLEMVRLAVAGEPGFEVSDIELRREGPSYTLLTVQAYRQQVGADVPLYWLIGGDTLPELHSWYHIAELVDLCRIVTAVRPGFETPDFSTLFGCLSLAQIQRLRESILSTPRIDISATQIRARVREGKSIRYLVPESVADDIAQGQLYH